MEAEPRIQENSDNPSVTSTCIADEGNMHKAWEGREQYYCPEEWGQHNPAGTNGGGGGWSE